MRQLIYSRINRQGRLANQLFFLSSSLGLARKSGRELVLPKWKYQDYFNWSERIIEKDYGIKEDIVETDFHYCGPYFDYILSGPEEIISIAGYLQSERYFKDYEKEVREVLSFKPGFIAETMRGVIPVFEKSVIALHIRRGDYIGNENYYQLPLLYYITALEEHFPTWMDDYNILVFSDDIKWCKTYLSGYNIFYSEGKSDIEDLCLLSRCAHFILANSSYSWWGGYLSNTKGKIIHPSHLFAGELYKYNNPKDFWPKRWIEFNEQEKKIDLSDCTFIIPVYHDHEDRRTNLKRVVDYLQTNFNTNIIIGEQGGKEYSSIACNTGYYNFDDSLFHRTRYINNMTHQSQSDIIINYDADVIVPAIQLLQAVKLLRKGVPVVFPYDGRFARVEKHLQHKDFSEIDISVLKGSRSIDPESVGGCIMFRKGDFISLGMENENFISYGPEDTERVERINKLGVEIKRIKGPLYHYDHYIGHNSSGANPHFGNNCNELYKIQQMDKNTLINYVSSWKWCKFAEQSKTD